MAFFNLTDTFMKKRRRENIVRRFAKDKRGTAAVEFSILVLPFFTILYSTYEVGWYYFATAQVDEANTIIGRELRTGFLRNNTQSADEFFNDQVCPKLRVFGDCEDRLTFEVQTFTSFQALSNDNSPIVCRNDSTDQIRDIKYDEVQENTIVRIRMCLLYDTLNPAVGVNLADADGRRRLTSTFVFRSEPFARN